MDRNLSLPRIRHLISWGEKKIIRANLSQIQYSSGNAVTRVTEAVLQNPSSGVRLKRVSLIPTEKPRASTQIMPQLLTVQCPILSQRFDCFIITNTAANQHHVSHPAWTIHIWLASFLPLQPSGPNVGKSQQINHLPSSCYSITTNKHLPQFEYS